MSKKRTRGVSTLPLEDLELLQHPLISVQCFGEEVSQVSSDDSLGLLSEIRDLGTGKSSSSSLSWGEEFRTEASNKVKDELERMERVLSGEEPIPSNYDREEYEEWMQFFPTFSIKGSAMIKKHTSTLKERKIEGEVIAVHSEKRQKTPLTIKKIPSKIARKPVKKQSPPNLKVDTFLKISPVKYNESIQRQQSSRSLISSHISSSKWLKDDDEFDSLPFLVENLHIKSGRQTKTPIKGILKHSPSSLVLPPIQQRSVSATPRRSGKVRSAHNHHQGSERKSTSRFSINNLERMKRSNVELLD